ncbi:MAG TPA: hypothetical protein VNB94_04350 [Mycobacteriales bacterium]|nr:hypothetical protein [Mycobacteriales bacterium]
MADETTPSTGMNRRDLMKRGAVVGTAVWAVPVVDSLMSPAHAQGSPADLGSCGRFTGGGQVDDNLATAVSGDDVDLGFTLHCNVLATPPHPQNLNIHFTNIITGDREHFKLETLSRADCTNLPTTSPDAPFRTFHGVGTGSVGNGPSARTADIEFIFTDNNEPSASPPPDQVNLLRITDSSGVILLLEGYNLDRGNFQAHQATGTRSCP